MIRFIFYAVFDQQISHFNIKSFWGKWVYIGGILPHSLWSDLTPGVGLGNSEHEGSSIGIVDAMIVREYPRVDRLMSVVNTARCQVPTNVTILLLFFLIKCHSFMHYTSLLPLQFSHKHRVSKNCHICTVEVNS